MRTTVNNNFYYPAECWNAATMPIYPLSCFVTDEIEDEAIQQLLNQNSIKTVQDLANNIECVRPLLREGTEDDLRQAVADALLLTTPEQTLGGKIIVYPFCVSPTALAKYSPQNVSVMPAKVGGPIPDFTLVMGPKGSGKTLFAVKRLPELIFPDATSSEILCLHYKPSPFFRTLLKNKGLDFATAVAQYVQQDTLDNEISGFGVIPPLQLYLHVVIDEVTDPSSGFGAQWEQFDSTKKLQAITNALKTMDRYQFAKGVHLTVVGSELERVTKKVDENDTIKFRMQPWKAKNSSICTKNERGTEKGGKRKRQEAGRVGCSRANIPKRAK